MSQVPAGMSKVFILDKYFNELQKFWDTEKRLKGKPIFFLTLSFRAKRESSGFSSERSDQRENSHSNLQS